MKLIIDQLLFFENAQFRQISGNMAFFQELKFLTTPKESITMFNLFDPGPFSSMDGFTMIYNEVLFTTGWFTLYMALFLQSLVSLTKFPCHSFQICSPSQLSSYGTTKPRVSGWHFTYEGIICIYIYV